MLNSSANCDRLTYFDGGGDLNVSSGDFNKKNTILIMKVTVEIIIECDFNSPTKFMKQQVT